MIDLRFLLILRFAGACHLREKVLAEAAKDWVIVADYRKNNKVLGDVSPKRRAYSYADRLHNCRTGNRAFPSKSFRLPIQKVCDPRSSSQVC